MYLGKHFKSFTHIYSDWKHCAIGMQGLENCSLALHYCVKISVSIFWRNGEYNKTPF